MTYDGIPVSLKVNIMNTLKIALVAALLATSGTAMADAIDNMDQATSVVPVYSHTTKTVCTQAPQNVSGGGIGGYVAPALGGAAGGLLGAQVGKGNGKVAAGVIGAVIGTMTGQALGGDNGSQGQPQRVCSDISERHLNGFIVFSRGGNQVFVPSQFQSEFQQ